MEGFLNSWVEGFRAFGLRAGILGSFAWRNMDVRRWEIKYSHPCPKWDPSWGYGTYSYTMNLLTRSPDPPSRLKEATGGEFRVYRASIRLLEGIYRPSRRLL